MLHLQFAFRHSDPSEASPNKYICKNENWFGTFSLSGQLSNRESSRTAVSQCILYWMFIQSFVRFVQSTNPWHKWSVVSTRVPFHLTLETRCSLLYWSAGFTEQLHYWTLDGGRTVELLGVISEEPGGGASLTTTHWWRECMDSAKETKTHSFIKTRHFVRFGPHDLFFWEDFWLYGKSQKVRLYGKSQNFFFF